jgi:hypothetical protein
MELSDCWFAAKVSEKFVASFFGVVHEEPPVEGSALKVLRNK